MMPLQPTPTPAGNAVASSSQRMASCSEGTKPSRSGGVSTVRDASNAPNSSTIPALICAAPMSMPSTTKELPPPCDASSAVYLWAQRPVPMLLPRESLRMEAADAMPPPSLSGTAHISGPTPRCDAGASPSESSEVVPSSELYLFRNRTETPPLFASESDAPRGARPDRDSHGHASDALHEQNAPWCIGPGDPGFWKVRPFPARHSSPHTALH